MAFMEDHGITVRETVDARRESYDKKAGLALAKTNNKVLVAKGKKLLEFRLKAGVVQGDESDVDLEKAIIGPSGRLRAPTLRKGKTLYVGFSDDLYQALL